MHHNGGCLVLVRSEAVRGCPEDHCLLGWDGVQSGRIYGHLGAKYCLRNVSKHLLGYRASHPRVFDLVLISRIVFSIMKHKTPALAKNPV
jgi:hypothetical protein